MSLECFIHFKFKFILDDNTITFEQWIRTNNQPPIVWLDNEEKYGHYLSPDVHVLARKLTDGYIDNTLNNELKALFIVTSIVTKTKETTNE